MRSNNINIFRNIDAGKKTEEKPRHNNLSLLFLMFVNGRIIQEKRI